MSESNIGLSENSQGFSGISSIPSENFYKVGLPVSFGNVELIIPHNGRLNTDLAAAILNVHPISFRRMLESGEIQCSASEQFEFVNSDEFMEFKKKWEADRMNVIEEIASLDEDVEYDYPKQN